MTARGADPPGWHGKLPALGDFASRRLPAGFVEVWDEWLAAGLLALREADPLRPQAWLEAYLASPSWRFVLMPGALPPAAGPAAAQAWAGVLMPSVDRVGRYYPLTIALALGDGPEDALRMTELWQWLGRLDELARDALHDDWTAERLEAELARMALPRLGGGDATGAAASAAGSAPVAGPGAVEEFARGLDAAAVIARQAQGAWAAAARGQGWWQAVPDQAARRLVRTHGLPPAAAFGRFFGAAAETIDAASGDRRP